MEAGGAGSDFLGDRMAGDRDGLDQLARVSIEPSDALHDHVPEAEGRIGAISAHDRPLGELLDEDGVPGAFASDGVGELAESVAEEMGGHRARVLCRQLGEHDRSLLDSGQRFVERGLEGPRCGVGVLRRHDQHLRSVRRADELREEVRAVDVSPLEVVEEEHDRAGHGDRDEQLAQRDEGLAPLCL